MPHDMGPFWEVSLLDFLMVTIVFGGGLAFAMGRSTARGWNGWGSLLFYAVLLTLAVRFIHFTLFEGTFFLPVAGLPTALHYGLVDFAVVLASAALGRTLTRSRQMARQYGFLKTPMSR